MRKAKMSYKNIALCVIVPGTSTLDWNAALKDALRLAKKMNMPVRVAYADNHVSAIVTPQTKIEICGAITICKEILKY